ncbi:MAG: (2Fe-2S) ferredoxin domain-containing protein [Clostridiales bacterium]|nr:(2Fe-2S) ferredoxin domain-containing protein [Clostridiales bacterium]
MIIQICVGSSCHLKGSQAVVALFQEALEANKQYAAEVTLAGCFCTGRCNREGVTVLIDDESYTGITPDNFQTFFSQTVLPKMKGEGN